MNTKLKNKLEYKGQLESPLHVYVSGGLLRIEVGLDRLEGNDCHPTLPSLKINDHELWGEDVARELCREEENGASIIGDALDKAVENAIDEGSAAIDQQAYERAMKRWERTR